MLKSTKTVYPFQVPGAIVTPAIRGASPGEHFREVTSEVDDVGTQEAKRGEQTQENIVGEDGVSPDFLDSL